MGDHSGHMHGMDHGMGHGMDHGHGMISLFSSKKTIWK